MKPEPSIWGASDRALEKENYVCFRCFQKLLFKGSENYDIFLSELTLPSAFLQDTGKADVSRARRSGDKLRGESIREGMK